MKNGLQYFYSIAVFAGVLVSAYLMINSENKHLGYLRAVEAPNPALRTEASSVDPALNQLFEMEEVLAKIRKEKLDEKNRVPTNQPASKAKSTKQAE